LFCTRSLRIAALAAFLLFGGAAPSRSDGFDLVGYLDPSFMINYTDIWGWSHPSNGRSYAFIGNNATGLHIVDVSDPANPFQVTTVTTVPRYDIKTYRNRVYTVDGLAGGAGGILDVSDPSNPVVVGNFPGGHNIWIDSEGFMYVALPGLKCYDLNDDPTAPSFAWAIESVDGHDSYVSNDILYDFRGYAGTFIYDVTNRYSPQLLGSITDPNVTFHHQGRLSTNRRYLYLCDEFATSPKPDITIWDLQNISNPVKVGEISDATATVHYCYVVGHVLACAYFTAGFKLFDISNPTQPVLMDQFDTSTKTGEGIFEGAYGCYPFGPGGTVYVSDRPNGLYVFQFDFPTSVGRAPAAALTLEPNTPNPFGRATTIQFQLEHADEASLSIYDVNGRLVRVVRSGFTLAGPHVAEWDGRDDAGRDAASGVYFCRLRSGGGEATRKMVLIR